MFARVAILLLLLPISSGASFQVPDGFKIERVASSNDCDFPMFATFDDKGRLFVAESSGLDLYAELSALTRRCRVRLLEDVDRDGKFERSQVFADELVFPMGLVWRRGKLYVADPPNLITIEDANGDGRGDKRTVILSEFGHKDNGSLHGLVFGPDGWLYMTTGSPDGYKFKRKDGSILEGESGALIRCRADGSDVEVLARGFENLVEVVFTPEWEIIGTDNWFRWPEGGVRDALVHLVPGGLYPFHREVGTPHPITGDPLPAMALYPAVALSGLMRYEGSAFPGDMRGNLFSAQHNARKVQRHVLIRQGSSYRVEDHDFLTTDDPDFHPSDVLEAPDGSVLVLDTGSWYTQHCPTGKIRNSQSHGGIYRIRYQKPVPGSSPSKTNNAALARMGRLTATELGTLLETGQLHEQLAAAEALVRQGSAQQLPALWNGLQRAPDRLLEHAIVYAIHRHASTNELRNRLSDPDARVQSAARRLLEQPIIARREVLWRDKLRPVSGEIPPDAQQKLTEYGPLIGKGNAQRGRAVFFSSKTACATCHAIGVDGGKIGPDLTKIGAIRSGRDILESILVPSATFAQGYQSVTIATQDGQEVQGIIASESPNGVSLRDAAGAGTRVRNDQIHEMHFSPVSLMPSGLEQGMTREEFADLLAYLQSLK